MTVSELIAELEKLKDEYGDLPVGAPFLVGVSMEVVSAGVDTGYISHDHEFKMWERPGLEESSDERAFVSLKMGGRK